MGDIDFLKADSRKWRCLHIFHYFVLGHTESINCDAARHSTGKLCDDNQKVTKANDNVSKQ